MFAEGTVARRAMVRRTTELPADVFVQYVEEGEKSATQ